jgi:hypothetical protein
MGFAATSLERVKDVEGFSVIQSFDDFVRAGVKKGVTPNRG